MTIADDTDPLMALLAAVEVAHPSLMEYAIPPAPVEEKVQVTMAATLELPPSDPPVINKEMDSSTTAETIPVTPISNSKIDESDKPTEMAVDTTNKPKVEEDILDLVRPYPCKICSKSYNTAWALRVHKRVHTGEKPYECEKCGKRFAHSGNLSIHHRTHTGIQPFNCEICKKGFDRASRLYNHEKKHQPKTT